MCDRIDPAGDGFNDGPWPQVTDLSRLYDHGWPWCANAAGHPSPDGGAPDWNRHRPWHECRSAAAYVDDACRDLYGEQIGVSVYNAAPFRFGQPRDDAHPVTARVVLETWTGGEQPAQRVSLSAAAALHLAHILVRYAEQVTFGRPAS